MSMPTNVDVSREHRIVGPPGTGKTTALTAEINNLTKNKKVKPADILVVSFTRAAAAEIASRGTDVPRENVSTLHAAGRRAIGGNFDIAESHVPDWNASEYGKTLPLSYITNGDEDDGVSEAPAGFGGRNQGDDLYQRVMLMRARMVSPSIWPLDMRVFHKRWEDWKKANNLIDYADMISIPLRDQLPPPGKPRYGIFDEFQDFTAAESSLARFWGAQMEQTVIAGDPDQTLYNFKGASAEYFDNPPVPDEQVRVLGQSYRVPANVQQVAQAWIRRIQNRIERPYRPRPEQGEVRFMHLEDGAKLCQGTTEAAARAHTFLMPEVYVEDAIDRYLSNGKRVMFLASCGYMLEPLIDVLRSKGIPFHNPYRKAKQAWNPLGAPTRGVGATERLLAFLRMSEDVWGVADSHVWTLEEFWHWAEVLKTTGVFTHNTKTQRVIKELYQQTRDFDPERLSQELDVPGLLDWLTEDALARAMEQNLGWFEKNLLGSKSDSFAYPIKVARQYGGAALRSAPQVIVSTIHSVKGGEADAVYLFPDISQLAAREWAPERNKGDHLVRLFYVAMTRAKESLIFCKPSPAPLVKGKKQVTHVPLDSLHAVTVAN